MTTIDIDPGVIEHTRRCLDVAGYDHVPALVADAAEGMAASTPYDCIIATTSTSDIPPAWRKQLAKAGRLVVPLRMRGLTRSVAFERHGDRYAAKHHNRRQTVSTRRTCPANKSGTDPPFRTTI